jgi:hypothetical protein
MDNTHSKLKIDWVSACDFRLTFIESNNHIRKNLSKPGEEYWYRLIDKQPGYYNVVAEVKETQNLSAFKIYY